MKKRNSILICLIIAIAICASFTVVSSASSLSKPVVSLSSDARGKLTVKSTNNKGQSGYQIKYSKSSKFTSAKTVSVATKNSLNKTFTGLSAGKKYYVKVRVFSKTSSGTKHYSKWSTVKSKTVRAYTYAYVNKWRVNLRKTEKSGPDDYCVKYMTKLRVYGSVGKYSKNQLVKVQHYKNGKYNTRYIWVDISGGAYPFTTKKSDFSYNAYADDSMNHRQEAVLATAISLYENATIHYDFSHKNAAVKDGTTGTNITTDLDCSGFQRYLYKEAMNGIGISYYLNGLFNAEDMYNAARAESKSLYYDETTDEEVDARWVQTKLDITELQPGDLLFFCGDTGTNTKEVDHVGLYLGKGEFIHSSKGESYVGMVISPLAGHYTEMYKGAGRFL